MCGDIVSILKWLRKKMEDLDDSSDDVVDSLLEDCVGRLANVVPHHCGLHEECVSDMCGFVKLKEEHPDWSDEMLDVEYDKTARFNGKYMSLSNKSREKVSGVITKKMNKNNIERLAAMKTSNSAENFFMGASVHSEGKRLNMGQENAWRAALYGVVCERTLR